MFAVGRLPPGRREMLSQYSWTLLNSNRDVNWSKSTPIDAWSGVIHVPMIPRTTRRVGSRGGLMAHPSPLKDAGLLIFLGVLAGVGLIGMFVLVLVRARLVRSLADLDNSLEVQKMSGIDLRRRLEDANRLLKQERERARTALDRVETMRGECDHAKEELKTQVHTLEDHFHECEEHAVGERESFLHQEHELILEVEECRADVKDLYEDLKAAHLSVQQHADLIEQWKRAYHTEADSHGNTAKELGQVLIDLDAHKAATAGAVPVRSYPASAAEGDLVMTHHPAHHPVPQAQPVPQQPAPQQPAPQQPVQQQPPAPQARAQPVRPAGSTLEDDMVRAEAAIRRANAPVHHQVPPQAAANPTRAQPAVHQPAVQQPGRQPTPQPARQPVPQPARQPAPQPVPPAGTKYPVEEKFTR